MAGPAFHVDRAWRVGEFDCCQDFGLCADVLLCGPCVMGRLYDALVYGKPDSMNGPFCAGLIVSNLLLGDGWDGVVSCLATCYLRNRMRYAYNLEGTNAQDCLLSLFCQPCAVYQMVQEAHYQGTPTGYVCIPPSRAMPSKQTLYGQPVHYGGVQPAYPAPAQPHQV